MQWGEVRPGGSGCPRTRSGTHYYEDQEDEEGTWWCRQCGDVIDEAPPKPPEPDVG